MILATLQIIWSVLLVTPLSASREFTYHRRVEEVVDSEAAEHPQEVPSIVVPETASAREQ